jgi:hypothetical protein
MTTPAVREHQSPLEAALLDVHATLAELLVAADEQHAAVVEHDRERLESVTRQQEVLSARLTTFEAKRLALLAGTSLATAVSALPAPAAARASALSESIAVSVSQIKDRQTVTANLLRQSIELADNTLTFLHRLVAPAAPVYNVRGVAAVQQSLLVDGRA